MDAAAEAERIAERRAARSRATAERSGETLLDLVIADTRTGLGGRYLLKLVKRNRTLGLPWNRLRVGAPVVLTPLEAGGDQGSDNGPQNGVVSARNADSIEVAIEHWTNGKNFDLDLAGDEVSRNRERAALLAVSQAGGRLAQLRRILLRELDPEFGRPRLPQFDEQPELPPLEHLNASQRRAIAFALSARDIAVIAPYAAQVRWLRQHAPERALEIDTVDGFQGREKEAVVISLVRSNRTGEIGFLGDTRRMNVALTRARRKLIVIGDSATLGRQAFYADLLKYFELNDAYRSVWEETL